MYPPTRSPKPPASRLQPPAPSLKPQASNLQPTAPSLPCVRVTHRHTRGHTRWHIHTYTLPRIHTHALSSALSPLHLLHARKVVTERHQPHHVQSQPLRLGGHVGGEGAGRVGGGGGTEDVDQPLGPARAACRVALYGRGRERRPWTVMWCSVPCCIALCAAGGEERRRSRSQPWRR